MHWSEDNTIKQKLAACEVRSKWAQSEAMEVFAKLSPILPEEMRQKSRIGPLSLAAMDEDSGELCCWMYPVDGSKFQGLLLGQRNHVKLVDTSGTIFFEGPWSSTTLELIEANPRFYVWVEPIERKAPMVFKIGV
ncbi:MAG: hypothetical protein H6617_08060 [Bdellovibrionaceae bacterium]|nr:hypothetical protein [Bdellovibrionales bacterium]MCB9254619.1 hypothetical protein [Pseudobdellovibrionaceae bacterium]